MSANADAEPTGIPGLDPLLGGGLPSRGLVFVVGPPGSGKTVFVQQLLFAQAHRGQAVLYFSGISEPHDRLVAHLRGFAFFDEGALARQVQFLSLASTLGAGVDPTVDEVIQTARRSAARLIVVDGFRGLRGLLDSERQSAALLYRLGAQIGLLGALLVVVLEGDPESEALYMEMPLGDVILALEHDSSNVSGRRNLRVLKRRGASPMPGLHAFLID